MQFDLQPAVAVFSVLVQREFQGGRKVGKYYNHNTNKI